MLPAAPCKRRCAAAFNIVIITPIPSPTGTNGSAALITETPHCPYKGLTLAISI